MHCPVCRAENDDVTCRRCKADLAQLAELENARRHQIVEAARSAAQGNGMKTLIHAEKAHRLRRDPESWRWLAVGGLLIRDFALARACWRQIRNEPEA